MSPFPDFTRVTGYAILPSAAPVMVWTNAPIHIRAPWEGDHNVVMLATESLACFVPVESFGRLIGW